MDVKLNKSEVKYVVNMLNILSAPDAARIKNKFNIAIFKALNKTYYFELSDGGWDTICSSSKSEAIKNAHEKYKDAINDGSLQIKDNSFMRY